MELMSVSDAIEEAVIKSRRLKEGIIKGCWREIVGKLSSESKPKTLKDGVLLVVVSDSIYLHHMSMNKNKYLKTINEILKNDYVEDIRFKISKIEKFEYYVEKNEKNEPQEEFISEISKLSIEEKIEFLKKKSLKREEEMLKQGFKKCKRCGALYKGEGNYCMPCKLINRRLEDRDDTK